MTQKEIVELLFKNRDERGIAHWEKNSVNSLSSFGIGLTKLKALAKKIGKNHGLALELWQSDIYDVKLMSVLIENAKEVEREQIDSQLSDANFWLVTHVYCSVLLAKVKFKKDLVKDWWLSKNNVLRRSAYLVLYELSKDKKVEDEYFIPFLDKIKIDIQKEENFVKDAMNTALFGIGKRSAFINSYSLDIAKSIGKITVNYGDNSCQALDCVMHLSKASKKF